MIEQSERDIHVLKYFSSFVSVSKGKVINVTDPKLVFCPLAKHLHQSFKEITVCEKEAIKRAIKNTIERKIDHYGFFTENRKFSYTDISVPYGASEMLMFALKKGKIDAAVVVCEGAGTVIADNAEVIQGIGARMNSLLITSPIQGITRKLKQFGCLIVFENALIDQASGVCEAIKAGYKSIAVTVSGDCIQHLKDLRLFEKEHSVKIMLLVVCTTGLNKDQVSVIGSYADLVWSCASSYVREMLGPLAIMQLSKQIPVFVLTRQGVDFVSSYSDNPGYIRGLDLNKQYLVSGEKGKDRVRMGGLNAYIREAKLPISARISPILEESKECVSA